MVRFATQEQDEERRVRQLSGPSEPRMEWFSSTELHASAIMAERAAAALQADGACVVQSILPPELVAQLAAFVDDSVAAGLDAFFSGRGAGATGAEELFSKIEGFSPDALDQSKKGEGACCSQV